MIYVCDAIMGAGKSSAMIEYMRSHPEKRYACIVPFISETARVVDACQELHFVQPDRGQKIETGFSRSKTEHCNDLFSHGKNVVLTHANFAFFMPETLEIIKKQHYTVFIDETLTLLEECELTLCDRKLLIDGGYLVEEDGVCRYSGKPYTSGKFAPEIRLAKSRNLLCFDNEVFYWSIPASHIRAFDDVFILTYKFEWQVMYAMMCMEGLEWQRIGVHKKDGRYEFFDGETQLPEYVSHLSSLINICDRAKLNAVGDNVPDDPRHPLSKSFYEDEGASLLYTLRKNLENYTRHIAGGKPKDLMWSTYSAYADEIGGGRYNKCFLAHNCRGVNDFRDKTILAYFVNVHMNVKQRTRFAVAGAKISDEDYALSTMIQWIWRSAIRDGKPVQILLPAERMRGLLEQWISDVEHQYAAQQKEVRSEA